MNMMIEEIGERGSGLINGYRIGKRYALRDPKNKKLIHLLSDFDKAWIDNWGNLVIDRNNA